MALGKVSRVLENSLAKPLPDEAGMDSSATVELFLQNRSELFARNFDANCSIHWLHKMDGHDVSRGRIPDQLTNPEGRIKAALALVKQPTLILAVERDMIFPFSGQVELANGIKHNEFVRIDDDAGHDFIFQGRGRHLN